MTGSVYPSSRKSSIDALCEASGESSRPDEVLAQQSNWRQTAKIHKRQRISPQTKRRLEKIFEDSYFPNKDQREELAKEFDMTPRAIQVWFQNKRQSWRRERKYAQAAKPNMIGSPSACPDSPLSSLPGTPITIDADLSRRYSGAGPVIASASRFEIASRNIEVSSRIEASQKQLPSIASMMSPSQPGGTASQEYHRARISSAAAIERPQISSIMHRRSLSAPKLSLQPTSSAIYCDRPIHLPATNKTHLKSALGLLSEVSTSPLREVSSRMTQSSNGVITPQCDSAYASSEIMQTSAHTSNCSLTPQPSLHASSHNSSLPPLRTPLFPCSSPSANTTSSLPKLSYILCDTDSEMHSASPAPATSSPYQLPVSAPILSASQRPSIVPRRDINDLRDLFPF